MAAKRGQMWSKPASVLPKVLMWVSVFTVLYVALGILFSNLSDDDTSTLNGVLVCVAVFVPVLVNLIFGFVRKTRGLTGLTTILFMIFGLLAPFDKASDEVIHKAYYVYLGVSYIGFLTVFFGGFYKNTATYKIRKIFQVLILNLTAYLYCTNLCPYFIANETAAQVISFATPFVLMALNAALLKKTGFGLGIAGLLIALLRYAFPEFYTSLIPAEWGSVEFVTNTAYFILEFVATIIIISRSYLIFESLGELLGDIFDGGSYGGYSGSSGSSSGGSSGGSFGGSLGGTYTGSSTGQRSHTDPGPAGSFCGMRRDG